MPDPNLEDSYLSTAQKLFGDPPPEAPALDPAADLLFNDRKNSLRAAEIVSRKVTPEQNAQARKVADNLGVTKTFAEDNLKDLAPHVRLTEGDIEKIIKETPHLSDWLSNPENYKAASDDIGPMGDLHKTIGNPPPKSDSYWHDLLAGSAVASAGVARIPGFMADVVESMQEKTAPGSRARSRGFGEYSDVPASRLPLAGPGGEATLSNNALTKWFDEKQQAYQTLETQKDFLEVLKTKDPKAIGKNIAHQVVYNVPQLATVLAASMAGQPQAGLALMGGSSAAQAEKQALDLGLDPETATAYGSAYGILEIVGEKTGTMRFLERTIEKVARAQGPKVAGEVMKNFIKASAAGAGIEASEEVLTEAGQAVADYAAGVDPDALKPQKFFARMAQAALVAAPLGGAVTGPTATATGYLKRAAQRTQSELTGTQAVNAKIQAEQNKATFQQMGQQAVATKTLGRNPQAFSESVAPALEGSPYAKSFIDREGAEQWAVKNNVDLSKVFQQIDHGDAWEASAGTGEYVEVPTADLLRLAKDPVFEGLADHVTFDPTNTPTPAMAKNIEQETAQGIETAQETTPEAPPEETPDQRVLGDVRKALKKAGERVGSAEVFRRVFQNMGRRAGVDPFALFRRFGYLFEGKKGAAATAQPTQEDLLSKSFLDLSPEERASRFFVHPVTQTLNERAFEAMKAPEGKSQVGDISVEGIKYVNDNLGHQAADDLYRYVGQALQEAAPHVARVGGDFALHVADQAELDGILEKAKDLLPDLLNLDGTTVEKGSFQLTGKAAADLAGARHGHTEFKKGLEASGLRAGRGQKPLSFKDQAGGQATQATSNLPEITEELKASLKQKPEAQAFAESHKDPRTGFWNYETWNSLPKKAFQAHIDLDGLGFLNNLLDEGIGDQYLASFGDQVREILDRRGLSESVDIARKSGDEFLAQADDLQDLNDFWVAVEEVLRENEIIFKTADGEEHTLQGVTFGTGIGEDDGIAEANLQQSKQGRKARFFHNVTLDGKSIAETLSSRGLPADVGERPVAWRSGVEAGDVFRRQAESGLGRNVPSGRSLKDLYERTPIGLMRAAKVSLLIPNPAFKTNLTGGALSDAKKKYQQTLADFRPLGIPISTKAGPGALTPQGLGEFFLDHYSLDPTTSDLLPHSFMTDLATENEKGSPPDPTYDALRDYFSDFPGKNPAHFARLMGDARLSDLSNQSSQFAQTGRGRAAAFYSRLQRTIEQKMGGTATAEQVQGMLKDLPQEERKWSGINEFLKDNPKPSKEDLLNFLKANQIQVKEITKQDIASKNELFEKEVDALVAAEAKNRGVSVDDLTDEEVEEIRNNHAEAIEDGMAEEPGDTKFEKYKLPGGENYREILFALPQAEKKIPKPEPLTGLPPEYEFIHDSHADPDKQWGVILVSQSYAKPLRGWHPTKEAALESALEELNARQDFKHYEAQRDADQGFSTPHFDEKNVLAHARVDDRTDKDGKKVLFIEEIQSDWHQKGRKEGYRAGVSAEEQKEASEAKKAFVAYSEELAAKYDLNPRQNLAMFSRIKGMTSEEVEKYERLQGEWIRTNPVEVAQDRGERLPGVPDAPFKKTWQEFVLKSLIRKAAEGGYDRIAWTTGAQQADRYNLSKHVTSIDAKKNADGTFEVRANPVDSVRIINLGDKISPDKLGDFIGKELADKVSKQEPEDDWRRWHGQDLKIGGEGMKGFYDKIIPDYLNKLGRRYGATTTMTRIQGIAPPEGEEEVPQGRPLEVVRSDRGFWTIKIEGQDNTWGMYDLKPRAEKRLKILQEAWDSGTDVHAFDITPELQDVALNEGFSLFQKRSGAQAQPEGQGDLFAKMPKPLKKARIPTTKAQEVEGAKFFSNTKATMNAKKELGTGVVKTPQDAALAGSYLSQGAVERFDGLVTDKDGKVLATVGGFKGGVSQTPIAHSTVIAEAFAVPGASRIWFIHNHPGGTAELSEADLTGANRLNNAFAGSSIEPMGILAIASEKGGKKLFAYSPGVLPASVPETVARGQMKRLAGSFQEVPEKGEPATVPVVEREIIDNNPPVEGFRGGEDFLKFLRNTKPDQPTIILVNIRNEPVAMLPYDPDKVERLRGTGQMDALYRAIAQSNGVGALIYTHGEGTKESLKNLSKFLLQADVTPMDAVHDYKRLQTEAESGVFPPFVKPSSFMRGQEVHESHTFKQTGSTPPGGEIPPDELGRSTFDARFPGSVDIFFRKGANASTAFHEGAHSFLFLLKDLAKAQGAAKDLVDDYNAVLNWFGVEKWEDVKRHHHEQFATAFEKYILEGKTPVQKLVGAFQRFKNWLVGVYKQAQNVVFQNAEGKETSPEISDEMRGVFDRMTASQEEIEAAEHAMGFSGTLPEGLDAATREQLKAFQAQLRRKAEETLLRAQMDEITKDRQAFLNKKAKEFEARAEEEVKDLPVFQAWNYLESKGQAPETLAGKYLKKSLDEKGIKDLETAADLHGFGDGEELARALLAEGPDGRAERVKQAVDAGLAPYRALSQRPEDLELEAAKALHTEDTTELLALEGATLESRQALSRNLTQQKRAETRERARAARQEAHVRLSLKPAKDAQDWRRWVTAEKNSAIKASKAIANKDLAKAAKYKREQMLNHALAAEALKNRAQAQVAERYLSEFIKRGRNLKGMPQGFVSQIDRLLGQFGLMPEETDPSVEMAMTAQAQEMMAQGEDPGAIADETGLIFEGGKWRPENLREFVARQHEDYDPFILPPTLADGPHFRGEILMQELRDLYTGVRMIAHRGRRYKKLLSQEAKEDIETIGALMRHSIETKVGRPYAPEKMLGSQYDTNLAEKLASLTKAPDLAIPQLVNVLTLTDFLDGGAKDGPAHQFIYRILKRAEDKKLLSEEKMFREVDDLFARFYKPGELNDYDRERKDFGPNIGKVKKMQALLLLLNWGNEGNRDRIRMGFENGSGQKILLSDEQIQGIIDWLPKRDYDFAQAVWDHLETYWPEIAKLEMAVNGVVPEKVDPAPVLSRHGTYRGGYYPIVFDYAKSSEAFGHAEAKTALYKQYSTAAAHTNHGHTQARVSNVTRPVRLNLDGLFNHLENVVHDLAFRPAVIDMARILRNKDVRAAVENAVGIPGSRTLSKWLQWVASDQGEVMDFWDRAAKWFRHRVTMSVMGLRAFGLPMDLSGNAINVWKSHGPMALGRVLKTSAADLFQGGKLRAWVNENSPRMAKRSVLRDMSSYEIAQKYHGKEGALAKFAFFFQYLADTVFTHPLWAMIYKNNVGQVGHLKAVDLADEAVIRSFGSGAMTDRVGAMMGGEKKKMLSMFYSWSSMMFNQAWKDGKIAGLEYRAGNTTQAVMTMATAAFFLWFLQGANENLWRELIRNTPPGGGDDEEKRKRIWTRFVTQPFSYIWGLRDVINPLVDRFFGRHYAGFHATPLEGALEDLIFAASDTAKNLFTDAEPKEKYAEQMAKAVGLLTGTPQQVINWALNFMDWLHDEGEQTWRALFTRRTNK